MALLGISSLAVSLVRMTIGNSAFPLLFLISSFQCHSTGSSETECDHLHSPKSGWSQQKWPKPWMFSLQIWSSWVQTRQPMKIHKCMAFTSAVIAWGSIFRRKQHDAFNMVVMSDFDGVTLTFKVSLSYAPISITYWFLLNCRGWEASK